MAAVVDSTTIQFPFPVSCYANSTTLAVTVNNPGTAQSNPLTIQCGPPEPRIFWAVNAAAEGHTTQPISPGELITLMGSDFGSPLGSTASSNSSTPITQIGSTQVLFDGVPAPVMYVSEFQINAAAPYSLGNETATSITVVYSGVASPPLSAQVVPSAVGLFTADESGTGPGSILNQDSTPNSASNPAVAGSVVTIYATGLGLTNPVIPDNSLLPNVLATPVLPVTATIDGQSAAVISSAAVPGMIGVLTVNVQVPSSAQSGSAIPVMLQAGASQSQTGVTVAIQ
jgi:uncharacterized protein (TIGR03437 family)